MRTELIFPSFVNGPGLVGLKWLWWWWSFLCGLGGTLKKQKQNKKWLKGLNIIYRTVQDYFIISSEKRNTWLRIYRMTVDNNTYCIFECSGEDDLSATAQLGKM